MAFDVNAALPAAQGTAATAHYAFASAPYEADYSEAPRRHLRDYVRIVYKYRWLAAACFAVVFGTAVLLTVLSPRLYTAATQLQVARQSPIQLRLEGNVLDLEQTERNVNGSSSFLATQVAMLESRDLAERVIRTRRLAENEAFLHPGSERGGLLAVGGQLLAMLRPRGVGSAPLAHDDRGGSGAAVESELIDRYMRWLSVRDVRGTDLVEVRFTTPSATLSAVLAAAHTQAYLEANEESRLGTDATARAFLDQQLRESEQQLSRAQKSLRDFATAHPNVAVNQEQKVVGQTVGELATLITKAEGQRVTLQSRFEFLTHPEADPLAYFLDKPGIQKLHGALLDLQAERVALDNRLGPNHEAMIELRRQEDIVGRQLQSEVQQEVAAVRAKFDAAHAREIGLKDKMSALEGSAIALRDLGVRYDLLENDVATATGLHGSLLKQQMETTVNSALAPTNLRVVERAEVPSRAASPRVGMNLALGGVAGLLLAFAATFLCEYFDDSVKSSEEMEGLLQLPALATIPNFTLARRSPVTRALGNAAGDGAVVASGIAPTLVVLHEPLSPVAEAFRALRTAVLFSTPEAPPKLLLVTSAGASEGKTVSSLNLAATLAEAGSRVLLIDVDLRKPSCHRALGITNSVGMSSFLAGQVELAAVIHTLQAPRIDFVPAGPTPPNPAELIGSTRMRETLVELRAAYDFIVLDSPPVLPVTDAVVLAREVDGVVQVVKGHDTPRELIRRARDQLQQANAHILGAVINNVDLGWGDLYFYNRYYGYYRQPASAVEAA